MWKKSRGLNTFRRHCMIDIESVCLVGHGLSYQDLEYSNLSVILGQVVMLDIICELWGFRSCQVYLLYTHLDVISGDWKKVYCCSWADWPPGILGKCQMGWNIFSLSICVGYDYLANTGGLKETRKKIVGCVRNSRTDFWSQSAPAIVQFALT